MDITMDMKTYPYTKRKTQKAKKKCLHTTKNFEQILELARQCFCEFMISYLLF